MNVASHHTLLKHIDNVELARLANIWGVQAATGQLEALGIAEVFNAERRYRIEKGLTRNRSHLSCSQNVPDAVNVQKFWLLNFISRLSRKIQYCFQGADS